VLRLLVAVIVAAVVTVGALLALSVAVRDPSRGPCGTATSPAAVRHVIWIWMENHGYDQVIGSSAAPFENRLAAQCGLATNFHAITHPSLPNYIAATSGGTQGVTANGSPADYPLSVPSIFSQVRDAGKSWRSYQESAPGNCPLTSSGLYAVRHDPAPYYIEIRTDCQNWDVPMGTTSGGAFLADLNNIGLPAFAFVTPNLCNDTHDCPIATGDEWLRDWVGRILASPGYLDGSTVLVITWDEDDGSQANRIPTIVVSPSTPAGTTSSTPFTHYSLLKTTEELLGIREFLGRAGDADTNSMRAAFNL
jgi:phosphatidylinositol-3-phosphatase